MPPKPAPGVYGRALVKAAELLGGRAQLCRELQVPLAVLQGWIEGRSAPPRAVFLRVVDLILQETSTPGDPDPSEPPAPRDACAGETSSTSSTLFD